MAIYPTQSNYIVDVDIITTTSFKAGMALMRDDNGRAIPADNSSLLYLSLQRKAGKFLGFASSDHDAFGNTIIVPDVIGSSYLDENRNFVRFENPEVRTIRRALPDLQDPAYNNINPTDRTIVPKRGIGVYNQSGEVYITDQFVRVLHGDFGQDYTETVAFNPGDLLTFGSGVNAGKLVKVNVNSIGTDIVVVGVVVKYITATDLLHFTNAFYSVTFSSSSAILALDAGNSISFSNPSSLLANDLTLSNNDGTLTNGVSYDTDGGGSWSFDGTNDFIDFARSSIYDFAGNDFTIMFWFYSTNIGAYNAIIDLNDGGGKIIIATNITTGTLRMYYSSSVLRAGTINICNGAWHSVAILRRNNTLIQYVDGAVSDSVDVTGVVINTNNFLSIGRLWQTNEHGRMKLSDIRIYKNIGFTQAQILAYYNASKSRYGL